MCVGLTPRLIYNNMYIYSIMHNLIQAASNFDKYEYRLGNDVLQHSHHYISNAALKAMAFMNIEFDNALIAFFFLQVTRRVKLVPGPGGKQKLAGNTATYCA